MNEVLNSKQAFQIASPLYRVVTMMCLFLLLFSTGGAMAAQTDSEAEETTDQAPDFTEEMAETTDEVNTNDPTAAAISVSFGWEFYDWYEDELASGETRPAGSSNSFNTRFVVPMAKGKWGSPWPIINRFSFSNVEQVGGTSGSGNAEFITLFIPKTWATGKFGIGPAINLPADDKQFGTDVWRFGFSAVILENSFNGRLMWGALIRQVWGKTKPNSNSVYASAFAFQPLAVLQLKDGWYISNGESPIAYNWQAKEWLVPLGFRLGKTIKDKRGGTWNVHGEYRTNVIYKDWPGSAAKNIIRVSASYTFAN